MGWAATRTRLVAQGALDALSALSFQFALPALILRLIAGQPLCQSFNPEFYTGYLASGAMLLGAFSALRDWSPREVGRRVIGCGVARCIEVGRETGVRRDADRGHDL